MRRRRLSKSNLMSARQCLKRVHLDINQPRLAVVSADTQRAFDLGHAVGEAARHIYGTDDAVFIRYDGGMPHALRKTARLVANGPEFPIFEATFEYDGVLVRVDALLPDGDAWRIVEVKASTGLEPHYTFDCAVQRWVFQKAGHQLSRIALAHVDNQFVYAGDGDMTGLLREVDLSEETADCGTTLPEWVRDARNAAFGNEPDVAIGAHCFKPYACPYVEHCWPTDAEHPLFELPRANKAKLAHYVADGYRDLRDVPAERLTEQQRRVQRITADGNAEILPATGAFMRALAYPRYYLDFESIGPPLPVFPGMRPYQALPIQWSCHFESASDDLGHADFLDLGREPPFRRLSESLIRALGSDGPILVYSPYESTMLKRLAILFPDLATAITAIIARLVDLKPIVQAGYYHPGMRGSWSIKALLAHVAPDLSYTELEEIQEGNAASSAYLEALESATSDRRRAEIDSRLRRYCRLDTEAMVRLVRFFAAN